MRDVYFVLSQHFMLLDLAGPAEVLQIAIEHGAPLRLHMVAAEAELVSSVGLRQHQLEALPETIPDQALVLLIGVQNSKTNLQLPAARAIVRWLQNSFDPARHQLACICSGALLAADAGLLAGRRCTTHHELIARLQSAAPNADVLENRLFVEDGPIATSAGICAGIDLALHLVARDFGAELTQVIAREMVIWLRRSGNDPQLSAWLVHRNHLHPTVHKAQDLLSQPQSRRWTLAELAAQVHVTPRTLSRLFVQYAGLSPHDYQQSLKLALAQQLLANPNLSIETVANEAGFGSARDFRRVWQARFGQLPSEGRKA
ncbi:helix-turn-helix domain-containing protein [Chitinibacter bivalviorum]|uniref:Helix-turn-helix domain-containing protein n=1 Tax=Chitinibacter bivalviorum TaxID=2739434 RepID=A0A7H9BHV2_9NEIS|nr:helix-turn-helix domain-containing protein [Chitinibacter bivalviorum]QLG87124.1 helix-turn-helix domain-containing protein [Chitinibacter bivalviorum]